MLIWINFDLAKLDDPYVTLDDLRKTCTNDHFFNRMIEQFLLCISNDTFCNMW